MKKKRVVIAMSGGVDSSVTAALLQKEGYECIGMHIEFWNDETRGTSPAARNKCCTLEGLEDARAVCAHLDIPFYVMNAVDSFKEKVVDYFLATYADGETPNPCVQCNRNIKFGQLLERALELDADFLATGHYAKVVDSPNGKRELFMARDKTKDQTYFIYHLSQEKLSHILFPLGDILKSEVYELAESFGLPRVIKKCESQGLCFFAESKPVAFLKRYLPEQFWKPGQIVTVDGREIGTHKGLPLYTIGQRSMLGIGGIAGEPEGEPWYVIEIDREHNRLVVSHKKDFSSETFECNELEFVSGEMPLEPMQMEVRIRHRGRPVPAVLEIDRDTARVMPLEVLRGIAPGQAAVFYQGEKVLGGGTIESANIKDKNSNMLQKSYA